MKMGSMECPHCKKWHASSELCRCNGAIEASMKPVKDAIERAALKNIKPTTSHKAFRDDLLAMLNKHAGALDASEMMALAAYTTGQIMAMQDARKWSSDLAMQVVAKNIEEGNAHAIADAHTWMGRA